MSDRLADVGRRIATVHQLGAVVNALRGIAAARAQQSRALLPAIQAYAETAVQAIGQAQLLVGTPDIGGNVGGGGKPGLIVFGAEQGFAGAFAEQILDVAAGEFAENHVFLIGDRAATLAADRALPISWQIGLPNRAAALADRAMTIVDALYDYLAEAGPVSVAVIYPAWTAGRGSTVIRRSLLPIDMRNILQAPRNAPLSNLSPADLLAKLAQEYVFAQLCEATVEAFAAENEARMATMAAAKTNIDGKLQALELEERLTRQDEITAEVVELAAGARTDHPHGGF